MLLDQSDTLRKNKYSQVQGETPNIFNTEFYQLFSVLSELSENFLR